MTLKTQNKNICIVVGDFSTFTSNIIIDRVGLYLAICFLLRFGVCASFLSLFQLSYLILYLSSFLLFHFIILSSLSFYLYTVKWFSQEFSIRIQINIAMVCFVLAKTCVKISSPIWQCWEGEPLGKYLGHRGGSIINKLMSSIGLNELSLS